MEHKANQTKLKALILCAGLLGAELRMVLYTTAMDHKGLLIAGHWAATAVLVLTFLVLGVLVFCCRRIRGPQDYRDSYPASLIPALGSLICAVGFLVTGLGDLKEVTLSLDRIAAWLSILSAAALVYAALCRALGKCPFFGAHALVCITFALRMVCQYRLWSSDPQLQDYVFYMLSHVGLMLTAYHLSAFDAGLGHHRTLWFLGLASTYLSLLSVYGCKNRLFMLCCALWALTCLSNLKRPGRRVQLSTELTEETPDADT